ncbi:MULTISPECIES: hypothetical protein [Kitasatospora]|uniref:hypothetical protein n=1 Tax=Kitasatospora TaxID=2063 RepID=UPI00228484EC|nr:hypothetical protein [Kitasatospora sp. YST-16]WAL71964.1 hypothetical protein OU787_10920 [Kitasatospora sp. YST-16]WNW38011.1 hypothetical protein RKE32_10890 [Streptomyces sp. Li-HN-5-13]
MSTSGNGFQVEVDNLRAFAAQVRGLLSEYESGASTSAVYGPSGVSSAAFGSFPEAQELYQQYNVMRTELSALLNSIQDAIDAAQQNADHTAANYEEHEQDTRTRMTLSQDGWATTWSQSELDARQKAASTPTTTTTTSQPTTTTRPQW